MSAKELFDLSVGLNMKEQLLIPVHNKQQQESLRVSLSYNRRLFTLSQDVDFEILISKVTQDDKYFVSLTKMPRITTGLVISPDGTQKSVNIASRPDDETVTVDEDFLDEDARIRKAMKDDGYSQQEIDEYFSKTSKNDTSLSTEGGASE